MRKLLLMGLFFSLIAYGATITRLDVVSTAGSHAEVSWVVNKINSKYPIYSTLGVRITGEAYSYGNKDTPMDFLNRIAEGKKPRNWQSNYQSNPGSVNQYAGVDCSGLVTNSWKFGFAVSSNNLPEYTGFVLDKENVKPGDIWWEPDHVIVGISAGGDIVYESNPYDDPKEGQRVQRLPRKRGAMALSIFPQFYGAKPENNEVLDESDYTDVSLLIYASGEVVESGARMFIRKDGGFEEYVEGVELIQESDNIWTIKKEDFDVSEGGNFTVKVIARNDIADNGYKDEYEWEFTVDPAPPIVKSTDPSKDSRDVPVDKSPITINFSKPMDVIATADAAQTPFACSKVWAGDQELQLRPEGDLDYCKEYTITVSDAAMDTAGVRLDGNNDGDAGDNYEFTFTTEPPEALLYINPFVAHVEEGRSLKASLITNGSELKKEIDCDIDFNVYNPGRWSVRRPGELSFSLSPGEIHEDGFTINNSGARFPLMIFSKIPFKCDEISCMGFYWSAEGHQHDHADENQSPGRMDYPTPWLVRSQRAPAGAQKLRGESPSEGLPEIGILLSGWADGYGHILGRYGIETLPVKPDLEIINNPETTKILTTEHTESTEDLDVV
jgi:hypothetical protein